MVKKIFVKLRLPPKLWKKGDFVSTIEDGKYTNTYEDKDAALQAHNQFLKASEKGVEYDGDRTIVVQQPGRKEKAIFNEAIKGLEATRVNKMRLLIFRYEVIL